MDETKVEEKLEAVEQVELCAIDRKFVISRLEKIYEANRDVFEEYNVLLGVLNTHVNMIDDSDSQTNQLN